MSRQPLGIYLHFEKPCDPSMVKLTFDYDDDIRQIFDNSFLIATTMSFSQVKHELELSFPHETFFVCKAKEALLFREQPNEEKAAQELL